MGAEERDPQHNVDTVRRKQRALSRSTGGRNCRYCGQPTAVRSRLPAYLRWLRRLGLDLRTYNCASCGRSFLLRHHS